MAIVAVIGLVIALLQTVDMRHPDASATQYVTVLGEQRAVVLEDGSVMQLNTDSAVQVRYGANAREIMLLRGEAMFNVRPDPARPFRVRSGEVRVEAVGTRFNVRQRADSTVVTVIEGVVAVESSPAATANDRAMVDGAGSAASAARTELAAGEQLAVAATGTAADVPVAVDTRRTTAWTQRRVMFDDDPLADVVAEFNRYNRIKLVIRDAVLRERRISGIFNVDDPHAFAEVLTSMAPVDAVPGDDTTLIIVPRENDTKP